MTANRADDPFDGLPLLIPVPQAAKLLGIMSKGMTLVELLALPLMIDVSTAARALGLSRSTGYELARRGEFPCRVLHVGSSYRVPTAELLRVLGIDLSELSPRFPAA
jgi:excisionase family DNA binding protein